MARWLPWIAPRLGLLGLLLIGGRAWAEPLAEAPRDGRRLSRQVLPMRPVPHITSLAQVNGFVWMGAPNGLMRADGTSLQRLPENVRPKPAGWGVVHLARGRDGILWVITRQVRRGVDQESDPEVGLLERLNAFDTVKMRVAASSQPLSHAIAGLCETGDGRLWVASHRGVFTLDRETMSLTPTEAFGDMPRASAIACDGRRVAAAGGGRARVHERRSTRTLVAPDAVNALAFRGEQLLAAADTGAFVLEGATARMLDGAEGVLHVRALVIDALGALWLGTDTGLHVWDGAGWQRLGEAQGLHDRRVTSLMADDEGGVWVGSRAGGAALIRYPLFMNVDTPANDARAVAVDEKGALWVSSSRGLARRDPNAPAETPAAGWREFRVGVALSASPGNLTHAGGRLWATTENEGLLVGDERGFVGVGRPEGLPRSDPRLVAFDRKARPWVVFADGSVSVFEPMRGGEGTPRLQLTTTATLSHGLCGGAVRAFAEMPDGAVYLGGDEGVTEVPGGRLPEARCIRGADQASAVTGFWQEGGSLWLSRGFDNGLTRLRGGPPLRLRGEQGLYCDSIQHLWGGDGAFLWSSCSAGVGLVDKRLLRQENPAAPVDVPAIGFDVDDGLRSEEGLSGFSPGVAQDRNGHVWVVTQLGLVVFDAPRFHQSRLRLRPMIEAVSINGETHTALGSVTAPMGRGIVEIKFAAPTFVSPSLVRARYRLVGLDDKWRQVRSARTVRYDRVPHGVYTFELQATDGLGRWSEVLRRPITLTPPLYRTWPFLVGCVGGLALLVLALHRARLERIVSRYRAVHEERQRIARDLHDGVAQAFTGIGLQLDALEAASGSESTRVREIIFQARSMVEASREETRRAIWNLREGAALPLPLYERLERAAQAAIAGAGHPVKLRVEADDEPRSESAMEEHEMVFIVQEAVTNAIKHGKAGLITIRCHGEGDELLLSVEDDGVGIPPDAIETAAETGHFGIMGMRERARSLGGELSVRPRREGGTQVLLLLRRPTRTI